MSEQQKVPESADHDPREAGFGPGEDGESIEEGRQAAKDEDQKDDDGDD